MAGEEVKEEVKVEVKSDTDTLGLFDVAQIDWNYFSPENAKSVRI